MRVRGRSPLCHNCILSELFVNELERSVLENILRTIEKLIPKRVYRFFQPAYHHLLAVAGAIIYRYPSRHVTVIFVTGTKGKSSTAEILNNIFEATGKKTALLGTIRFKVGEKNVRNLRKMTIPGRFFVQKFLRDAVNAKCDVAIVEMTSEATLQFRHRFIDADALIFTNLAPEHIERHGSFAAYRDAKLDIARAVADSSKSRRIIVANADDPNGALFLAEAKNGSVALPYSHKDGEPIRASDRGCDLVFRGAPITSRLPGRFNAINIIAAATCAEAFGIPLDAIARGVATLATIPGRAEHVEAGQPFQVVVDYAHTTDSLEALYAAFPDTRNVCVLGNTGGGRDKWKRPEMAAIAAAHCAHVILTNEDPYDEDPTAILRDMEAGLGAKEHDLILDRREAIRRALEVANEVGGNTAVLITGKGTDPYIMGPNGTKEEWDDRAVARQEIEKLFGATYILKRH